MANDSTEVVVAGDGSVYLAPLGTAFSDDIDTAPIAPWVQLGYIATDGMKVKISQDSKDINAFQSLDPLRTVKTKRSLEISFKLMQTGPDQVELAFGGGSWAEVGTTNVYKYTPPAASFIDERAMIVEVIDGTEKYRYHFPRAVNNEGAEITYKRDEEGAFDITMTVLQPASGDVFNIITNGTQFEGAS